MEKIEPLIEMLRTGNQKAFHEIFDIYYRRLFGFVYSITKSKYAAEEIIQEVFIKIWVNRSCLKSNHSFTSYIYAITKNHTINYLRKVAAQRSLRDEMWKYIATAHEQLENDMVYTEYQDIVKTILDELPKKKKSIFLMSRMEGKSNQEIASLLGISNKTVKNNLWKTLQIIKARLEPHIS